MYLPTKASHWKRRVLPAILGVCACILPLAHHIMPCWWSPSLSAQNLWAIWVNIGTWIHSAHTFGYWILGISFFQGSPAGASCVASGIQLSLGQEERWASGIPLLCSLTGMLKSLHQIKEKDFELSYICLLIYLDICLFCLSVICLHGYGPSVCGWNIPEWDMLWPFPQKVHPCGSTGRKRLNRIWKFQELLLCLVFKKLAY